MQQFLVSWRTDSPVSMDVNALSSKDAAGAGGIIKD